MNSSEKPFIIPIFIPHAGCPHCCAFCNQNTITGHVANNYSPLHPIPSDLEIKSQIEEFLSYKKDNRKNVEIAFYGGNFLGCPPDDIFRLLNQAQQYIDANKAGSIRFSTRPDTVTKSTLEILKPFSVSVIELGAQSMNDDVLKRSLRGHTADDTRIASALVKQYGYRLGIQMMTGLPGEEERTEVKGLRTENTLITHHSALSTALAIAELGPEFVRIYPTVVIKGSILAKWYQEGKYRPMSLAEAVSCVKNLYLLFREKNILVIRMGLQASSDLDYGTTVIDGPYHPAFGHLVMSEIFLDKTIALMLSAKITGKEAVVRVHPKSISQFRGEKNGNITILKHLFGCSVRIIPDASICREEIMI